MSDFEYPDVFNRIFRAIPEQVLKIDGVAKEQLSNVYYFNNLIDDKEASIDPNANVQNSNHIVHILYEHSKPHWRRFGYYLIWNKLRDLYGIRTANRWLRMQLSGQLYLHDSHLVFLPYCYAMSVFNIAERGITFIEFPQAKPPKHVDSFINHVINYVWFSSNQLAGASAIPDFFVGLAYFVEKDVRDGLLPPLYTDKFNKRMEQYFQSFTFYINQPTRNSIQSSYTNITLFDKYYLEGFFGDKTNPDGSKINFTLVDYLQRLYARWFVETSKQQIFTFPVLTAMFLVDENRNIKDLDFLEFISKLNAQFGQFNIFISENISAISSCCRLVSNLSIKDVSISLEGVNEKKEQKWQCDISKKRINSFGSGDIDVGSVRVITLNLPRIIFDLAHEKVVNGNFKEEVFKTLKFRLQIIFKALKAHREIISEFIKKDLLPLYKEGYMDLQSQYSTVGIVGLYEMIKAWQYYAKVNFIDKRGYYTEEGFQLAREIMEFIGQEVEEATKTYGVQYNIEQVPAESAAIKLLKKDMYYYGDDVLNIVEARYYANQWYPLQLDIDITEKIRVASVLDKITSGGAILHLNFKSPLTPEQMKRLIYFSAKKGLIYFAVNYKLCRCENGHTFIGTSVCPICGAGVSEVYTRIVGYFTPISSWSKERREDDFPNRYFYKELKNENTNI